MGINIKRSNTIIYCRRWQETVTFYRDRIGLNPVMEREWFVEFRLNNGATLSVADENRASISPADGNGITISLRVDDVVALHNHLTDRGGQIGALRSIWGSRAFYLHDPEGNRLEFWS